MQVLQPDSKLCEWTHIDRMIHGLVLATHTQRSDVLRPHLCRLGRQWTWPVWKWFSRDRERWGTINTADCKPCPFIFPKVMKKLMRKIELWSSWDFGCTLCVCMCVVEWIKWTEWSVDLSQSHRTQFADVATVVYWWSWNVCHVHTVSSCQLSAALSVSAAVTTAAHCHCSHCQVQHCKINSRFFL